MGNYGIFLIMGNAGFISSTDRMFVHFFWVGTWTRGCMGFVGIAVYP